MNLLALFDKPFFYAIPKDCCTSGQFSSSIPAEQQLLFFFLNRPVSAVRCSTEKEREEFRKQEKERYQNAHKPYIYKTLKEDTNVIEEAIVGPIKVKYCSTYTTDNNRFR